jgi:hypothetical protein
MLISRLAFPAILTATCYFPLHAHGNHKHAAQSPLPVSPAIETITRAAAAPGIMGMEEKPGAQIPLECRFVTETGDTVSLRDVVKGPTILSILYYS